MKKSIKIHFVDFWNNFDRNNNPFVDALKTKYNIIFSETEPELLFFSVFGTKYKNYRCKRIFYTGENVRPNYDICDFSFTFDYINDKRNYRLPLYPFFDDVNKLLVPKNIEEIKRGKTRFCNFIYSNPNQSVRNKFFQKLSKYKKVDSGGKFMNNIGYSIPDKLEFISQYKFTIAFENFSYPGYTTEKIFEPMLVNSIPIYWGNELIGRDFNTRSFVNYFDFDSEDDLIEKIIEIDKNYEIYEQYLLEPYFCNNELNEFVKSENILEQLEYIINDSNEPVANSSLMFSGNPIIKTIEKVKIEGKYHSLRYINKVRNFSFTKLKIKLSHYWKK